MKISDGDLQRQIYRRRFCADEEFRKEMYRVLCSEVFQKYIPEESTVLEIGAGYCEFINNISAKKKIALDMNPDLSKFAEDSVQVVVGSSTDMKGLGDCSIDIVFANNFFEHLTRDDILRTIIEVHRLLKVGGRFLILQPNIRFCYKDYWMFFDHITPLDDRCLSEILELSGFQVKECIPRFLPYTTKGRLPKSITLLRAYLKVPLIQRIIGKQALILSEKY